MCLLSKMFALDVMSCVCYVGRGVFGFFPSEAQKRKVLGFFPSVFFFLQSTLKITKNVLSHSLNK